MHLLRTLTLLALSATASNVVLAQDAKAAAELIKASGCTSCHAINEKIVGPSFQDVSAKYAGDKDAVASLVQSIKNGSVGKWGKRIAMPPHASISNDDLKTMATWVMAQKP